MKRRPPRSTRTDTLFPYTTLFRFALASATTAVRHYGAQGQANEETTLVFFETFAPPPRLVIFGAVDFTAALVRVAKVLGYHVTVCDAREVFATKARFPLADEVVVNWPHRHLASIGGSLGRRDAVCVLSHDAKFDVPAIRAALQTAVGRSEESRVGKECVRTCRTRWVP